VDAVSRLLLDLIDIKDSKDLELLRSISKKNGKSGIDVGKRPDDIVQFDNILPPELPTSWVQVG
jgi:hypothetical protein